MTTPSIFTYQSSHQVRTLSEGKEVWFVAKDIFETLELSWIGNASLKQIPDDWRGVRRFITPHENQSGATGKQQEQDLIVINFKGVCKIAFRSNKPEADKFTNWCAEVIDQVCKTGRYESQPAPVDRYINLTTHPAVRNAVINIERRFWFDGRASAAVWSAVRRIGGARATEFPESMLPHALQEISRIAARTDQFFNVKINFEEAALKWVFGNDAALIEAPPMPQQQSLQLG